MATETEVTPELTETSNDNPYIAEESAAFSADPPKRKRGGQRKDGAPPGTAPPPKDVPTPRYTSFYSDHDNPHQKTRAAWTWWKGLKPAQKDLLDAHVYRSWPVLLDPLDEKEHKYIDKIIGSEPIQNDQDFVDRFGAGDYVVYLNVNPVNDNRRTLFIAYVKCTHDFRKFTPTDRRIDDIANLSVTDPANAAYVAWLRANGKIKDEVKDAKEKEDMATATAGVTELLGKSIERGDRLMEKLVEVATTDNADVPAEAPSPKEVFADQVTMFKSIKELVPTSDPLAMVTAVIEAAKVLNQSNSPQALSPFMDRISQLEEKLRTQESEMLRGQLTEIKDQLRALKETPPAPNVLLPDGSNINDIIQRAVEKFADKAEPNPWIDIATKAMPVALPILGGILQRFLMPTPQPQAATFPQPPPNYQAGAMPQQQAQLPAPTPQPQVVQQPQGNAEQLEVERILTAISAPVIDALAEGREGDDFADYVREEYGAQAQRLIAKFQEAEILGALYVFPLIAPRMAQFPQDRVAKFVHDFKEYDRDKYDAKMDARGGAA
jgi:hypothetical protein